MLDNDLLDGADEERASGKSDTETNRINSQCARDDATFIDGFRIRNPMICPFALARQTYS